ncbi:MAG: helix-turn-helix transcriptional regulator [Ferruginibacter sp.]|nr:helix-turn-helix transcriptional regulator [Ferruginibacter sp.]
MTFKNTNIIIGNNIRQLRNKIALTQEELAGYLETSREQVAYYENGSRSVSSIHLNMLANLFCTNEYDFFEENPQQNQINVAFAFRANTLSSETLKTIAQFKKIVRNYINMENALQNESSK